MILENNSPISISGVERDTGISKDTLRKWEQRYNFPNPVRNQFGDRVYPVEQVRKLRMIKLLIDHGLRPHLLVSLSEKQLIEISNQKAGKILKDEKSSDYENTITEIFDSLIDFDQHKFKTALSKSLIQYGIQTSSLIIVPKLFKMVEAAWLKGEIKLFQKKFFSEQSCQLLEGLISSQSQKEQGYPRVLLTTLPGEREGLPMILLESIFRLEGVECLSLGTEMPIVEIPFALKAFNPDQLILTFNNPKISQKLKLAYDEIKPFLVPFKTELLVFLDRSKKEKNLSLDTPVFHDFESIKEYVLSWKDKYYKIT